MIPMFRVIALANAALAAGWQGVGLAHRGLRTHRRQAVPMMGWIDDLTDGLLGEASGIPDGGADDLRLESELADALAENRAADGFDGRALRDFIVQKWGVEYDIDFTRTDYLGKASLYLNIFPWTPDRTPYRHASPQGRTAAISAAVARARRHHPRGQL